jgi:hypothetical protein
MSLAAGRRRGLDGRVDAQTKLKQGNGVCPNSQCVAGERWLRPVGAGVEGRQNPQGRGRRAQRASSTDSQALFEQSAAGAQRVRQRAPVTSAHTRPIAAAVPMSAPAGRSHRSPARSSPERIPRLAPSRAERNRTAKRLVGNRKGQAPARDGPTAMWRDPAGARPPTRARLHELPRIASVFPRIGGPCCPYPHDIRTAAPRRPS